MAKAAFVARRARAHASIDAQRTFHFRAISRGLFGQNCLYLGPSAAAVKVPRPRRCARCGIIGADAPPKLAGAGAAADIDESAMAKLTMPKEAAKALSVPERLLLFCVASETDWRHGRPEPRLH
jgi:hypothetical protein